MMKSTGIVRKAIYTKEGKIGVVKDIIIENGPWGQELLSPAANTPKGYASPDWWVSHLEIELDETVKKELVSAKKIGSNQTRSNICTKTSRFW